MKQLEDVKILVVGDIMLDKYIIGDVHRISPEAPVPVVHVTKEYDTLGGCGNVARNLSSIGCQVTCLASIGNDFNGQRILDILKDNNIGSLICKNSKTTTVKERIVAGERQTQMLRVDWEYVDYIQPSFVIDHIYDIKKLKFDYIIISDYAKGFITSQLVQTLKLLNVPIVADPKPKNISLYSNVFMITPNKKEFYEMGQATYYSKYTLVTCGRDGMRLYEEGIDDPQVIEAVPVDVYNVSGAGDTAVAIVTASLAQGYNPLFSAKLANYCAGYVITKPGTSAINKNKYMEYLNYLISKEEIKL